eukprot:TRINITY_DN8487_c0_g1_i1.p1 TRINITY_DN8487_c0_g1~~TRINITY_DN8487_c0_g1_i1.p1  ORF type:complete len:419 (-),score=67.41 TRINITY_DN8487_c0_g1_i1:106-1335(-)
MAFRTLPWAAARRRGAGSAGSALQAQRASARQIRSTTVVVPAVTVIRQSPESCSSSTSAYGWERLAAAGALCALTLAAVPGGSRETTRCATTVSGPLGTLPPPPDKRPGDRRVPPRDPQGRPRVAFQGELGAYSEVAVNTRFGEGNAIPVPCDNFDELVELVSTGQVERGLLPVENSLAGSIHKNYDLLLKHTDLYIVGEVTIPIAHCLLALDGTRLKDVKRVLSHPVALAQCERYLQAHELTPEVAYDTAGSARLVAEGQLRDAAAIAGRAAGRRYGLKVLAEGIQDEANNFTRFLELSREPAKLQGTRRSRTSFLVAVENKPGSLVHLLTILSMRGLDMTKLESRPVNSLNAESRALIAEQLGDVGHFPVAFLIDVTGSTADRAIKNAIAHMQEEPLFLRVLGSYDL